VTSLSSLLSKLTDDHRERLEWFRDRAGQEIGWPGKLSDDRFLCSRQGGIFKPGDWEYALSVRQSKDPNYPDMEPIYRQGGGWSYQYYQEKEKIEDFDKSYRNLALMRCKEDKVPVAVFRQTVKKPAKYRVLGLAMVDDYEAGYFQLEGFDDEGISVSAEPAKIDEVPDFDPNSVRDGREKIMTAINKRRGGKKFRKSLIEAYSGRCAMTGCITLETLQAAHIKPYMGVETNHVQNGMLLRSDIHDLFDCRKVAVDTNNWRWIVHTSVTDPIYRMYHGSTLYLPVDDDKKPSKVALDEHRMSCGL
jgi:putative restriction endonuclease